MAKYGYVHSWELVTSVDGPGTRLVFFMQGCPLRCIYCQNPDTWGQKKDKKITESYIIEKAKKYKSILQKTGGITFTGGEPLLQIDFLHSVIKKLKELNIHVTIDTSGHSNSEILEKFLKNVDLVLLDIKTTPNQYLELTTKSFFKTNNFIKILNLSSTTKVWVRFVLIPNITSDEKIVYDVGKIASSIKNLEHLDVLSFHQFGREKWDKLGLKNSYKLKDTKVPSANLIKKTKAIFNEFGIKTP